MNCPFRDVYMAHYCIMSILNDIISFDLLDFHHVQMAICII